MSHLHNVLLLESITDEAYELLSRHTNVIEASAPDLGEEVIDGPIHGIVTRGKGKVDHALIDACRGLKAIARCGVGLDNIVLQHATTNDIKVINAPGSNADTVAEHTLALMLTAQRKMVESITSVNTNRWSYRKIYNGDEIRGKTLGIIGMGDIGQKVGRLAEAFGMKVIYWNRSERSVSFTKVDLPDLLASSDIISIHLALTPDTAGLLSADSFKDKPHHPILINTARGGIIDDKEVAAALDNNYLSAFASDVLATEPPRSDSPLLSHPHAYITPHIASLTARTYNKMCVMTVEHLIEVLGDREIDEKYIANR